MLASIGSASFLVSKLIGQLWVAGMSELFDRCVIMLCGLWKRLGTSWW